MARPVSNVSTQVTQQATEPAPASARPVTNASGQEPERPAAAGVNMLRHQAGEAGNAARPLSTATAQHGGANLDSGVVNRTNTGNGNASAGKPVISGQIEKEPVIQVLMDIFDGYPIRG